MTAAPKVLIAEDDALQAVALRMAMVELGYAVCAVVDTSEEAVKAGREQSPDLAILDVALARGSSGLDAARHLTADRAIPVIVCSAHAFSLEATRAGATFFLRKPYTLDDLRVALAVVTSAPVPNGEGAAAIPRPLVGQHQR